MYGRPFSLTHKYNGLYYTVDSVADVIVKKEGRVRVDLISIVSNYEFFSPPKLSSLSKLKCDALFYAREKEMDAVCMRLYYVCKGRDDTKIKYFEYNTNFINTNKKWIISIFIFCSKCVFYTIA